ncbi:MAG: TPM domain-containing protein [Bacteroidia bacterium]
MKLLFTLILLTCSIYVNAQVNIDFDKDSLSDNPTLVAIPDSRGFVNDRARTFTAEEVKKLTAFMKSLKLDSTQVTVLTINTLKPFDSLEDLATQYANMWNLGREKKNGVMLIFSKELKKSRVQVGESLESKFTPDVLKSIDSLMVPEFVKGNYYGGTIKALTKINQQLKSK